MEAKFDYGMAIRCGFQLYSRVLPTLLDFGEISRSRSGFPGVQVRNRMNVITAEQYPDLFGLFEADLQNIQRMPSPRPAGGVRERNVKKENLFKALNINASRVFCLFEKFSSDTK